MASVRNHSQSHFYSTCNVSFSLAAFKISLFPLVFTVWLWWFYLNLFCLMFPEHLCICKFMSFTEFGNFFVITSSEFCFLYHYLSLLLMASNHTHIRAFYIVPQVLRLCSLFQQIFCLFFQPDNFYLSILKLMDSSFPVYFFFLKMDSNYLNLSSEFFILDNVFSF